MGTRVPTSVAAPPGLIAIVGAGIAGLSAAWEIFRWQQLGEALGRASLSGKRRPPAERPAGATYQQKEASLSGRTDFVVLDAGRSAGGLLQTVTKDGFVCEAGPDSFLTQKTAVADLCRSLGMEGELIPCLAGHRPLILHGGRLCPLPEGWQFLAPSRLWPVVTTPLLSPKAKASLAWKYVRGGTLPATSESDESIADFVRRELGAIAGEEILDNIVSPLLSGIYGGDAGQLSLLSVLPRAYNLQRRGDFLKEMRRDATRQHSTAPMFTTLRNGMGSLIDRLMTKLPAECVRFGAQATAVASDEDCYQIQLANGDSVRASGVILAVPAWQVAGILRGLDPVLSSELDAIPYASAITVSLGFNQSLQLPPGFGFLVPRSEGKRLLACTFVHQKFPHRVPAGGALLRVFYGDEPMLSWDDDRILELARSELAGILGMHESPAITHIARWPRAMAQYRVGHADRVARIDACLRRHPRLLLAGNAYRGIGVPDCVLSGRSAARALLGGEQA